MMRPLLFLLLLPALALATPPAPPSVNVNQNPPGNQDSVQGFSESSATIRVYSDATLTQVVVTGNADIGGVWGPLSIGDNQYPRVYVTATNALLEQSSHTTADNDIQGPTASITYSKPAGRYRNETLALTATFGEPLPATPSLTISGGDPAPINDISASATMSGSGSVWTFSYPLSTGDDGTFSVAIDGPDAAGNPASLSNQFFIVDTIAPATTLTLNRPSANYVAGPFVLTATFSEAITPTVPVVSISDGDAAPQNDVAAASMSGSPGAVFFTYSRTIVTGDDGFFTIDVTATDAAGNAAYLASSNSFNVDTVAPAPPALTLTAAPPGSQDQLSGRAGMHELIRVYTDSSKSTLIVTDQARTPGDFGPLSLGDNLYPQVFVTATDSAGNESAGTTAANDIGRPGLASLVFGKLPAVYRRDETLRITATFDEDVDLASVQTSPFPTATMLQVNPRVWTYARALSAEPEGLRQVTIGAADRAGNRLTAGPHGAFVYDATAPSVSTLTYSKSDRRYGAEPFLVTATFSEEITPQSARITITGGTVGGSSVTAADMVSPGDRRVWRLLRSIQGSDPPGERTVSISGADAAGNASTGATPNSTFQIEIARSLVIERLQMPPRVGRASSVLATMTVLNPGPGAATVESAELTFDRTGLASTPLSTNPTTLTSGQSGLVTVKIESAASSALGDAVASAHVRGFSASGRVDATRAAAGVIAVVNSLPVARIAAPRSVTLTQFVTLDGRASRDPEGAVLIYRWRLVSKPPASAVTTAALAVNDSRLAAITRCRPDRKGQYVFGLAVDDGLDRSLPVTVSIQAVNSPPVAVLPSLLVTSPIGRAVRLDGSKSFDPDPEDTLTYSWSIVSAPSGSVVTRSSIEPNNTSNAFLSAFQPDLPGDYKVSLAVSDPSESGSETGASGPSGNPSTFIVRVVNTPPVARIAIVGKVSRTAPVVLDGAGSRDGETPMRLTYRWSLLAAPAGSVSALTSSGALASFRPDRRGAYTVGLIVLDGFTVSAPATEEIVLPNAVPVASASPAVAVTAGYPAGLDGSASSDIDPEDALTYSWRVDSVPPGSAVTAGAIAAATARVSFVPDIPGKYGVSLRVLDGTSVSSPFETAVFATAAVTAPIVLAVRPVAVPSSRATTIELFGAGFLGATSASLSSTVALQNVAAADDSRLSAVVPAGVAPGSYDLRVTARGVTGSSGSLKLRVTAAEPIVFQPGSNGLTRFGPEHDFDEGTAGVQARIVYAAGPESEGRTVRLSVGNSRVLERVTQSVARFDGLTLLEGSTYLLDFDEEPSGRPLARPVLSRDGPPAARPVILSGANRKPQVVTLDGSTSRGEPLPLGYRWTLDSSPLGADSLFAAVPVTRYRAVRPGLHRFVLAVQDGAGRATTSAIELVVANVPPLVQTAGHREVILPRPGVPGSLSVELDARGSRDLNDEPLSYSWQVLRQPPSSVFVASRDLVGAAGPRPRLELSDTTDGQGHLLDAGEYVLQLTVRDPQGSATSAVVRVIAIDPRDLVPAADAGLWRTVRATVLSTNPFALAADIPDPLSTARVPFVRLDGRKSVDANVPPRPLAYAWEILAAPSGSVVSTLSSSATATPTFVPDRPGEYRFGLTVSNQRFTSERDEVSVRVFFRDRNRPPRADVAIEDSARGLSSRNGSAPLTFTAGADEAQLIGRLSSDPDAGDRLQYAWTQLEGPSVDLQPSETAADVTFVPAEPGRHVFRLTVTDAAGDSDSSEPVALVALAPSDTPPSLSIVATAPGTDAGEDYSPDDPSARPGSLRVSVGTTVTLAASASDPDAGQQLALAIRQVAGPTVLLTTAPASGANAAVVQFTPTTGQLHVFEASATELDQDGVDLGVGAVQRINVLVDSGENGVPVAAAALRPASKDDVSPCSIVQLDGSGSMDVGPSPTALEYRWVQVQGPPVVLSSPFGAVTTFVVPDFADDAAHSYVFHLFVEDSRARSEPAPLALVAGGQATAAGLVRMARGLNLVSMPVDPGATQPYRLDDLLTRTGAGFGITLSNGTFRVVHRAMGPVDEAIEAGQGWMLTGRRDQAPMEMRGRRWPAAATSRRLAPGLNLIAYPRSPPAAEDAERLRARSGAAWVVATDSQGKFCIYLPGLSPPFPVGPGSSYLLSAPRETVMTFPTCEE